MPGAPVRRPERRGHRRPPSVRQRTRRLPGARSTERGLLYVWVEDVLVSAATARKILTKHRFEQEPVDRGEVQSLLVRSGGQPFGVSVASSARRSHVIMQARRQFGRLRLGHGGITGRAPASLAEIGDLAARRYDRLAGTARTGSQFSKESSMSVYRVTEIIGTSNTSWEDAAAEAIRTAAGTLRDLRVAEVVKQDIHLEEGGAITYRTKLQLSFKYEHEH